MYFVFRQVSQRGGVIERLDWFDFKEIYERKKIPLPQIQEWWAEALAKAKLDEKDVKGVNPDYPERVDHLVREFRNMFTEDKYTRQDRLFGEMG